jgi:2-polyprenyl-3-methyl-5-hydroxy-6-metoxy-1,4-benzoquinol methylase
MRDTKRFFYEGIAHDFDQLQNMYDLRRRLEVVEQELEREQVHAGLALDAGCGNGEFSVLVQRRAPRLVSLDISVSLVKLATQKACSLGVVADALALPFQREVFDVVVSSELVEHTQTPVGAVNELVRVLRPCGLLVLTTPNHRWEWLVRFAATVKMRGFHGYENFLGFRELGNACTASDLDITRHFGFHPWPFQLAFMRRWSAHVDAAFGHTKWGAWMINQVIVGRKPRSRDSGRNG